VAVLRTLVGEIMTMAATGIFPEVKNPHTPSAGDAASRERAYKPPPHATIMARCGNELNLVAENFRLGVRVHHHRAFTLTGPGKEINASCSLS